MSDENSKIYYQLKSKYLCFAIFASETSKQFIGMRSIVPAITNPKIKNNNYGHYTKLLTKNVRNLGNSFAVKQLRIFMIRYL